MAGHPAFFYPISPWFFPKIKFSPLTQKKFSFLNFGIKKQMKTGKNGKAINFSNKSSLASSNL